MQRIFADFQLRTLMSDPSEPGVFMKATRPIPYAPIDLTTIDLHHPTKEQSP
jgi:hypothetical protein